VITALTEESDMSLILRSSDSDLGSLDIVPIPSEDENFGPNPEDQLRNIILQWDLIVSNIKKLSDLMKGLKSYTVDELDTIDEKILALDTWIRGTSKEDVFEECVSAWDSLISIQGELLSLHQTFQKT